MVKKAMFASMAVVVVVLVATLYAVRSTALDNSAEITRLQLRSNADDAKIHELEYRIRELEKGQDDR